MWVTGVRTVLVYTKKNHVSGCFIRGESGEISTEAETVSQEKHIKVFIPLSENAPYWSFNSTIDTDFIDLTKMLITMSKV